jgi:hypothetical protein
LRRKSCVLKSDEIDSTNAARKKEQNGKAAARNSRVKLNSWRINSLLAWCR